MREEVSDDNKSESVVSHHPDLHKDPVTDPSDDPHDQGGNHDNDPFTSEELETRSLQDVDPEKNSRNPHKNRPSKGNPCCGLGQKLCAVNADTTRPNYKYIALMFVALFSSSFTLTFLFPFLPDMVKWMGYSEEEKGYYVGLIASSVFAGRACGSYFWGWLSDIKGRKLVLLLTIAGNGVSTLLFGLSVNLPMAMVFRFFAGLANGTVGTAKTVLYEISDNTNQAMGMSAISLAWGCGLIVGPTIGGYLASPAVKYTNVFSADGFFAQYPFFLPSLVTLFVCCVGFIIVFFKFEETLQKKNFELDVQETNENINEGKPLTHQGSISASQINICRSIESLHRGPMAAMSVEDVYCAAEAGSYFAHSENDNLSTDNNLHPTSISSQEKVDSVLVQRNGLDVKNTSNKTVVDESERTVLLDEDEVRTFFNTDTNISTASLQGGVESTESSVPRLSDLTKDDADNQTGSLTVNDDALVIGHSNGLNGCHKKEDSVTIVYERQMTSIKVKKSKPWNLSLCCSSLWHNICNNKLVALLRVRDIRNSIFAYTVFSFGVIGSEDVFTIFLSTDPSYNGIGFSSNDIGLSLGVVSAPLLVLQLFFFPVLEQKLGLKKTFLINGIVLVVTVQLLAMLHPLHDNPAVLWTLLLLILLPQRLSVTCCFSSTSLMINNSSNPQNAGTVNGIAMTMTAFARTLAPTIGGGIFAWSISYGAIHLGPPFDHNLAFILFGFVFFISVIQCLLLPEKLNKQTNKS